LKMSTFPTHEIDTFLMNKKQIFLVNNQKVANVARKKLTENIFGSHHPYGLNLVEKDFDTLKQPHLEEFYRQFYTSEHCKIVIAGKVLDSTIASLDNYFGGSDWSKSKANLSAEITSKYLINSTIMPTSSAEREVLINTKDAVQSAIRMGKLMFNKTHSDYQSFQVLNTILGGYFGSRLMSNIREDKGYTYGINSGLVSLNNGGYFFIATEVGVDVCQKALDEIYIELNRLQEKLVGEDELLLVKNFLLGSFLRGSDGPFAMADRFKAIMKYGLDYDYYDKYVATIKDISASTLRELANKYLTKETMLEVVVGKK
jgi:zinc protease